MLGMCRLGLHKPVPSQIWNAGFYFTRCSDCDRDMIRTAEGRWRLVPRGTKVVWRPSTEDGRGTVQPQPGSRESLSGLMTNMGLLAFEQQRPQAEPLPGTPDDWHTMYRKVETQTRPYAAQAGRAASEARRFITDRTEARQSAAR
jgi:hypothetical protein